MPRTAAPVARALVIQTAFIGDAILVTPVLEKLRAHYPEAEIDVLVRKGNEGLFQGHPFLGEALVWDKKKDKRRNLFRTLFRLRAKRYDLVVNAQRFLSTGILAGFSGARHVVGFDKNPLRTLFHEIVEHRFEAGAHETARNLKLVERITDEAPQPPRLYPSETDRALVAPFQFGPYVCMAPTSVWFTKQFPAGKWAELIQALPFDGPIYLVGGPGDWAACEAIKESAARGSVENLCGKLNLLQSAALFEGAVVNYVNDSAPMHLCSSVDAPVCAVYCSTVPGFGFGPLSSFSRLVETQERLPCRPCGLHGKPACPEGHFQCAQSIGVKRLVEVFEEAQALKERERP